MRNQEETRERFARWLYEMVEPLKSHYTPEKAGLNIGHTGAAYEDHTIPMEGWSRILWGLVPLWKGDPQALPEFQQIYRQGLAAGTDPGNAEYWGDCHGFDQRFVEMAAIAYGLLLVPDILWKPLSGQQQKQVAAWLYQCNEKEFPSNNWQMFAVLVNTALKKLGMPYDEKRIQEGFALIDSFYQENGWYTDGTTLHHDYYIPFAIQFYNLVYYTVQREEDPERCALIRERAELFGREFLYWFDERGRAVAYGRSLTYRFAQAAFWSACLMAGIYPVDKQIIKGLLWRHMEEWMKQPIFDNAGILSIGYGYPQLFMQEAYNAPGSPYWSFKVFACLALPEEDSVWQQLGLELPQLESVHVCREAGMVLTRQPGNVCLYPDGWDDTNHSHFQHKYSKFVYSTLFGFDVPKDQTVLAEAGTDSMLAFEVGGMILTRRSTISSEITEQGHLVQNYEVLPDLIHVETELVPKQNGHERIHRIFSKVPCKVYDCGFAVKCEEQPGSFERIEKKGEASVTNSFSYCKVASSLGEGMVIRSCPNLNLLYPKTEIPAICISVEPGECKLHTEISYGSLE